jgi:hypothetical protein
MFVLADSKKMAACISIRQSDFDKSNSGSDEENIVEVMVRQSDPSHDDDPAEVFQFTKSHWENEVMEKTKSESVFICSYRCSPSQKNMAFLLEKPQMIAVMASDHRGAAMLAVPRFSVRDMYPGGVMYTDEMYVRKEGDDKWLCFMMALVPVVLHNSKRDR